MALIYIVIGVSVVFGAWLIAKIICDAIDDFTSSTSPVPPVDEPEEPR